MHAEVMHAIHAGLTCRTDRSCRHRCCPAIPSAIRLVPRPLRSNPPVLYSTCPLPLASDATTTSSCSHCDFASKAQPSPREVQPNSATIAPSMRLILLACCLLLACLSLVAVAGDPQSSESPSLTDSPPSPPPAPKSTLLRERRGTPRSPSENRGFGPESAENWAGYVSVHNATRHLWYWFFESRHDPSNAPLAVWLSGGPGCSSLIGLFVELGPYRVQKDLSLELNPHSWNERANIIFIDQPVGTGFSFSDRGDEHEHSDGKDDGADDPGPLSQREIAEDLYEFLVGFLRQYPRYAKSRLFLTGESYAGHYLPAFAARIMRGNEEVAALRSGRRSGSPSVFASGIGSHGHAPPVLRLAGVAIGNGLLDARSQIPAYSTFARDHGVISAQQFESMQALLPGCLQLIDECSQNSTRGWHRCLKAHVLCTHSQVLPVAYSGVNPYDVRLRCGDEPLCYDLSRVDKFLQQRSVRDALGVRVAGGRRHFQQCNMDVNGRMAMAGDWNLNFATDLPDLLRMGVRVLVYAGDQDFICNWYGQEEWLRRLRWSGSARLLDAHNSTWVVDGEEAGSARSADGLTFVRVNDAGHMVPLDQPRRALDLFTRFIHHQPFDAQPAQDKK